MENGFILKEEDIILLQEEVRISILAQVGLTNRTVIGSYVP